MWFHESVGSAKIVIGISTLLASLLLVPVAAADTVVPPGNGAATQYTEAFPTSGGNTVSGNGAKGGGNGGHSSPSHVLGHHNAEKLEDEGQVGREVAKVAAETAPAGATATSHPGSSGQGKGGGSSNGSGAPAGDGGGGSGSPAAHQGDPAESGSGSSGLGEVLGQATGSSSGESGLLLPLILLAAVLSSIAYAWRRRRLAH
jgi:hypothetical protein